MSRQRVRAGITLAAFMVGTGLAAALVVFAAVSMTGPADEPAKAAQTADAPTTTPPPTTEEPLPTTTEALPTTSAMRGASNKSATSLQVNIGDCVSFSGAGGIDKTACGSANSVYKVIEKAPANAACPTDADRTYSETLRGAAQAALCLDINWVVGGCMELTPDNPKRLDCAAPAPGAVRVIDVKQNTVDVNACGSADSGIVYQQRHFVVCVARL
ncbi:LppU family putative lipoprotein [Nocardia asiatica]|uniref:LppU family putative lipoprotein n=1 Tax=Nocardia asiatica TaxID=209252 RepID=UPI003EE1DD3E